MFIITQCVQCVQCTAKLPNTAVYNLEMSSGMGGGGSMKGRYMGGGVNEGAIYGGGGQ